MATYATKQDLIDRDAGMLDNFALDPATGELNDIWIDEALATADDEINARMARRYTLPLPTVPDLLTRIAVVIAFYWLADRDNMATNLLEERYKKALADLKEIASGAMELGLPATVVMPEGSQGKVELLQENERLFTRNTLKGVL